MTRRFFDPLWTPVNREPRNQPVVHGQRVRKRFPMKHFQGLRIKFAEEPRRPKIRPRGFALVRFRGQQTGIREGFPDMQEVMRRKREIKSTGPYTYQPVRRRLKNFRGATLSWQGPLEKKPIARVFSKNQKIANAKMKIRTRLQSTPRLQKVLENMPVGAGRLRVNLLR